jgi:hypothetical protein
VNDEIKLAVDESDRDTETQKANVKRYYTPVDVHGGGNNTGR